MRLILEKLSQKLIFPIKDREVYRLYNAHGSRNIKVSFYCLNSRKNQKRLVLPPPAVAVFGNKTKNLVCLFPKGTAQSIVFREKISYPVERQGKLKNLFLKFLRKLKRHVL